MFAQLIKHAARSSLTAAPLSGFLSAVCLCAPIPCSGNECTAGGQGNQLSLLVENEPAMGLPLLRQATWPCGVQSKEASASQPLCGVPVACCLPFTPFELFAMSSEPLDRDTLFKKLRSKPENKVGCHCCLVSKDSISTASPAASLVPVRSALIARPRTPPGPRCPMVCTYAWPVPASTAAWACTSASSGRASSTALLGQPHGVLQAAWGWSFSLPPLTCVCLHRSTTLDTWTEDQLRVRHQ